MTTPSEWQFTQSPTKKNMVRVGPVLEVKWTKGRWQVANYGWVSREFWPFISDFVSSLPSPPPGAPPVDDITPTWNAIPYAEDVDRRLRLSPDRSMMWSFAAFDADGTGGDRFVAILGHANIVQWTWFDAYVGRPVLRACAWIVNLFH